MRRKRYAHAAAPRGGAAPPEWLGMKKVVSEYAIRRAFKAIDEREGKVRLRCHMSSFADPPLAEPADRALAAIQCSFEACRGKRSRCWHGGYGAPSSREPSKPS